MALVKCKQCGNDNAKDAKTCPKCGTSLKMGLGTKVLIGLGALVALSVISRAGKTPDASVTAAKADAPTAAVPPAAAPQQPTAVPQPEKTVEATEVDIKTLLSEYKSNEVRADAAYKDKYIVTTGTVGNVKKDLMGKIYVTIGTGKQLEIPEVQCFIDDSPGDINKAAQLSKGDKVTVVGRVSGLMMNVLVKECRFAN